MNNGGGVFVQTLYPTGNGSLVQFTPKSSTNWSNVKETGTDDGNNTYNETSITGAIDTFRFAISGQPYKIFGIQQTTAAKRVGFPLGFMAEVVKTGNLTYTNYQKFNDLHNSYDHYSYLYETPPSSSGLWTKKSFESGEFGYRYIRDITPSGWPG